MSEEKGPFRKMHLPSINMRMLYAHWIIQNAQKAGDDRWKKHPVNFFRALKAMRTNEHAKRALMVHEVIKDMPHKPPPVVIGLKTLSMSAQIDRQHESKRQRIIVPSDMMFVSGTDFKVRERLPEGNHILEIHCRCRKCGKTFEQRGYPVVVQCPNCDVSGIFIEDAYLNLDI
jgi:hypothetical protein